MSGCEDENLQVHAGNIQKKSLFLLVPERTFNNASLLPTPPLQLDLGPGYWSCCFDMEALIFQLNSRS